MDFFNEKIKNYISKNNINLKIQIKNIYIIYIRLLTRILLMQ